MSASLITVVAAGALGVAATAVGAALTWGTSVQTQGRTERRALEERYHAELRSAITEFCTAMMIYRGAELDRWEAKHGGPYELKAATDQVYKSRTIARDALYRVELSTRNEEIRQMVQGVFEIAKSIKEADSEEDASKQRNQVEMELAKVIVIARDVLGVRDLADPPS